MKRMLFVTHRVPYPPDKGERVRAFHEIQALTDHFDITLATLAHNKQDVQSADILREKGYKVLLANAGGKIGLAKGAISLLTGSSVTEGYFHSRRLRRLITAECRREPFDIAMGCCSAMLPYVLAAQAGANLMDLVDVDSEKWTAYADSARWPKSWLYRSEGRRVSRLEQRAVEACDATLLVSQAETDVLGGAGNVHAITNGVDADFFSPTAIEPVDPSDMNMVFTGQMDYRPNVEGVCWFAREVWPELKRRAQDATFTIVGRNPSPAVGQLAEIEGIEVTGSVPDVRPYLAAAGVAICPLNMARGIQNKVLEAMAMEKAVVASSPALEGINAQKGKHVLCADSPQQWHETILPLLDDSAARESLGRAARQCVLDRYTWEATMKPLITLCHKLVGDDTSTSQPTDAQL